MKHYLIIPFLLLFIISCSDKQGELVEKDQSSTPSKLSAMLPGHPPVSDDKQDQGAVSLSPPQKSSVQVEGNQVKIGPISFEIDPNWIAESPSSRFRAAQFRLPPAEGEAKPVELAIFQGIGGTAEQNIQRWINQFKQPDGKPSSEAAHIDKKEIDGFNVQVLDITGTYSAGMMGSGGPQENQRMLAAVAEGPGGPWHFKLVGPEKTVAHWKPAFEALIASLKEA